MLGLGLQEVGVPKEEPDPNGSNDRWFMGPLGQLPRFPWLSPFRVSRWLSFHYGFSCLRCF